MVNKTSRSITVTWEPIACIHRNGPRITSYAVMFGPLGRETRNMTSDRMFHAEELIPNTNYSFQVAGVNSQGDGPFTNASIITTEKEG